MRDRVNSIIDGLNNRTRINESNAIQQNKNMLSKIQREFEKALSSFGNTYSGITYAYFTKKYYEISLQVSYHSFVRNLSWEEYNGKVYLMAEPYMKFLNYADYFTNSHLNDLYSILKDYIVRLEPTKDMKEAIYNDTKIDIKQLREDIKRGKSPELDNILYPKAKKALDYLMMNPDYTYSVDSHLYPEVKNRNKIPILIFDPALGELNFKAHITRGSGLNPEKDRERVYLADETCDFLKNTSSYAKTILDKLQIERWVGFTVYKKDILTHDIRF